MNRGHLEQRPNGRWRYRAPGLPGPGGLRRPHSLTFDAATRKEAEREATRLLAEWDKHDTERAAAAGTVAGLIDEWETFKRSTYSPTTIARNDQIVRVLRKELGAIRLGDLTARHIDHMYRKLATTQPANRQAPDARRAPATIERYHRVLRAILQQGYKWRMVSSNEADRATLPRVARVSQESRTPTLAALQVMLEGETRQDVRVAVLLAATTGARRGELVALRWSDLAAGRLVVARALVKVPGAAIVEKSTKSGAVKVVPLPPAMLAALEAHREWQAGVARAVGLEPVVDGRILADLGRDVRGGVPHAPDWLSGAWERMCRRSGVAFKFHGLRHMHGSLLVDAGVPLATVAKRQGHSVAVAADRYVHAVAASDLAATVTVGELTAPLFESSMGQVLSPESEE